MGVYIKGMEMPKKIEPWLVIEFADNIDGKRYTRLNHYRYSGLTDWFETVSVPPHGRLIDADALLEWVNDNLRFGDPDFHAGLWHIISAIEDAPTIIPPEE